MSGNRGITFALATMLAAAGALAGPVPDGRSAQASGPAAIDLVVPRYLVAGGAPGAVVAQVRDAEGAPVADGITVTFTASLGVVVSPIAIATEGGEAVTAALPATMAGFALITARAGDARDDQLLWVRPGPAAEIASLLAAPSEVPFAGTADVVLRARDAYGQAAEGDAVDWSVHGGTLFAVEARVAGGAAHASVVAAPGAERMVVDVAVGGARGRLVIPVRGVAPWHAYLPIGVRSASMTGRSGVP